MFSHSFSDISYMSENGQIENREYKLPKSGLSIKNLCLLREDSSSAVLASISLKDIECINCRVSVSWTTLLFVVGATVLTVWTFNASSLGMVRVLLGVCLGLITFLAFIGGVFNTELRVKSRLGSMRFPVLDQRADGDAFVVTVKKLQEQAKE